jgi:ferrous iron transport protein B
MSTAALPKTKTVATVALAGNPNVGKSTLFNTLTGLHQHVGNWTGKTVERKEGEHRTADGSLRLIDLPGTYSLSALSPEELIAREFIAQEHPDAVINLVDAANLERNLYLTLQVLELTDRVVVALNMMDIARRRGIAIDVAELERRLGVPVVPLVAERKEGQDEVVRAIRAVLSEARPTRPLRVTLPKPIEQAIAQIAELLDPACLGGYDRRWFARKLLEGDGSVLAKAKARPELATALEVAAELRSQPEFSDVEAEVIEAQYGLISEVLEAVIARAPHADMDWTDRIDAVVTHRILGLPILLGVFALMFWLTFSLGAGTAFNDWFSGLLDQVGALIRHGLVAAHAPAGLIDFAIDGVWAGFSTVAGFFPLIAVFFTAFAILEDSGYLARAAFVVDRFMGSIGLHGRSFLPLLMGFGCNVPAVMATRIIENRADRLLTILINPLMLCQARLVVFVFFIGTFFSGWRASLVMLSLYGLSAALVLLTSLAFKKTLFPGEPTPFIMELPPYHRPIPRNVAAHAWRSTRGFLQRAGGLITVMTAVVWLLTHLPPGPVDHSIAGVLGRWLEPLGRPAGLDWRSMVSLMGGFLAKEGALASMAVIYGAGEHGLGTVLRGSMSPLAAYSFMVVSLVYVPCFSTVVSIWRETLSWRWTTFATTYGLVLAFVLGTAIYQIGHLLGWG